MTFKSFPTFSFYKFIENVMSFDSTYILFVRVPALSINLKAVKMQSARRKCQFKKRLLFSLIRNEPRP